MVRTKQTARLSSGPGVPKPLNQRHPQYPQHAQAKFIKACAFVVRSEAALMACESDTNRATALLRLTAARRWRDHTEAEADAANGRLNVRAASGLPPVNILNHDIEAMRLPFPSGKAEAKPQQLAAQEKVDAERKANAILRNIAFHVAALVGAGTGDRAIFDELRGGRDSAGIVAMMSSAMSVGGLLELLLTQGVGGLTDRLGRRWGFLVYPTYCFVGGMAVFLFPKSPSIVWTNRVLVWSLGAIFGGIAHSGAAMSDVASGEILSAAYSKIFAYIGVGVLVGISVGSKMHAVFGARYSHLCRAMLGLIQLVHNYKYVEETLPPEKRNPAPLTLADCNPMKFLNLFRHSRGLTLSALCVPLAHCAGWSLCFVLLVFAGSVCFCLFLFHYLEPLTRTLLLLLTLFFLIYYSHYFF
jgi:MFS family permease